MKLTVTHTLTCALPAPSRAVEHVLLTALSTPQQRVERWSIEMPGFADAATFRDGFGNKAHLVSQTKPGETLVVVTGDMGRTPKVNKAAGRDHWPQCGFCVFAGGGTKAGVVHGTTDKIAASKMQAPGETKEASRTFAEPPGSGWVAQVQTFGSASDAEALAGRLKGKGYRTFVTLNESGPPTARYRVRIGKYPTRSEAVTVGQKLQREERFEPWVTR